MTNEIMPMEELDRLRRQLKSQHRKVMALAVLFLGCLVLSVIFWNSAVSARGLADARAYHAATLANLRPSTAEDGEQGEWVFYAGQGVGGNGQMPSPSGGDKSDQIVADQTLSSLYSSKASDDLNLFISTVTAGIIAVLLALFTWVKVADSLWAPISQQILLGATPQSRRERRQLASDDRSWWNWRGSKL